MALVFIVVELFADTFSIDKYVELEGSFHDWTVKILNSQAIQTWIKTCPEENDPNEMKILLRILKPNSKKGLRSCD